MRHKTLFQNTMKQYENATCVYSISLIWHYLQTPNFLFYVTWFSSVQFSLSVVSDSWQPHGPQHTRLPCPSPTPGAYSNSCPSSRWCHQQAGDDDVTWCTELYNTVSRNGRNSNKCAQEFLLHCLKALSTPENYLWKYDL